jgi:aryl-alcohol dehydrogenase-like predicted oxidoreductase
MGKDRNERGISRRWIVTEIEHSLRRLGTDHIDLYQIHRPDPTVEIDETLGALDDLVRAGKVLYIGSSTFPAHEVVEAQWSAARNHTTRFVCEQPPYSILVRGIENDVLPVAQRYGMGVIPWSPLAGGYLSGRYRAGVDPGESHRDRLRRSRGAAEEPPHPAKRAAAEQLAALADEAGISMVDLSLAFVLNHPAVTSPIIGPRTMEQLETQLGAPDVRLSPDVLDRIDEIVPPGVNLDPADVAYVSPGLSRRNRRR